MGIHRQAARRDDNEAEIVDALRKAGCSVFHLNEPCDLLISRAGVNYLAEIKDPAKPPSARRLTEKEAEFHDAWRGQIAVVKTVEDALRMVNLKVSLL